MPLKRDTREPESRVPNVAIGATSNLADAKLFLMDHVDAVVIGAGVVGLAVARALTSRSRDVLILEAADSFGTETSSRNSEVIHAGIYYPLGSLKARM